VGLIGRVVLLRILLAMLLLSRLILETRLRPRHRSELSEWRLEVSLYPFISIVETAGIREPGGSLVAD
jgi:hypothetical protein